MSDAVARRTTIALCALSATSGSLALLTYFVEPYGLFHDELYYWANARRPGLGYVDHPPLAPWILAATQRFLGDDVLGFAAIPALCSAGTVFLSGRLARTFGAGAFGQLLAALSVAVVPVCLIFFSFFSVNAIELLLWTAASWVVAEQLRTGDDRLWLVFGAIAGLALLNKHTFALFGFGLAVGLLATPQRAVLRCRQLWIGALLAALLALPNVYWNAVNDWPSLAFYTNRSVGILDASIADAIEITIWAMNPANLLIWLPGLGFLLFARSARPYRTLGIAFLVMFAVVLFAGQRRVDRMAGAYPIALAAGAVVWDRFRPRFAVAVRSTLAVVLLASGVGVALGTVPLLPPKGISDFFEAIGEDPEIEVGDLGTNIPAWLTGRLEWERFAAEVVAVWEALPDEERERAVVIAPHWLYAAVLEYYTRNREAPPIASPHNAYYFWRGEAAGRDVVITVRATEQALTQYFARTREVGRFLCEYCTVFRPDIAIHLSHEPVRPIEELLAEWRHFGITPAPVLREGDFGLPES